MNLDRLIVALDSGHGGHQPGAIGRLHQEKYYNLLVTEEVRRLLLAEGAWPFTLRWSRELGGIDNKQSMRLKDRANVINAFRAGDGRKVDAVLSIHHNAVDDKQAHGFEVWHYPGSVRGKALAIGVLDGMADHMPLRNRGRQSTRRLAMLKRPRPPSIITEGGFVSNAGDEQWLSEHTDLEARGIVEGLKRVEW